MNEKRMGLLDHLEELRRRILISLLAILVLTAVALVFSDTLLKVLLAPSGGLHLNAFSLMDGFLIRFRIALYLGVAVAFPIWGYELYRFVAPGLQERERRAVLPGLLASTGLFILGVIFGYVLLRTMIRVMVSLFSSRGGIPAGCGRLSLVRDIFPAGLRGCLPASGGAHHPDPVAHTVREYPQETA